MLDKGCTNDSTKMDNEGQINGLTKMEDKENKV